MVTVTVAPLAIVPSAQVIFAAMVQEPSELEALNPERFVGNPVVENATDVADAGPLFLTANVSAVVPATVTGSGENAPVMVKSATLAAGLMAIAPISHAFEALSVSDIVTLAAPYSYEPLPRTSLLVPPVVPVHNWNWFAPKVVTEMLPCVARASRTRPPAVEAIVTVGALLVAPASAFAPNGVV